MKTLKERIEAGARRVGDLRIATFGSTCIADEIIRTAFPELFTDPPTAWIAPWEASEEMCVAGLFGYPSGDDVDDLDAVKVYSTTYRAMRDAHLRKDDTPA